MLKRMVLILRLFHKIFVAIRKYESDIYFNFSILKEVTMRLHECKKNFKKMQTHDSCILTASLKFTMTDAIFQDKDLFNMKFQE